VRLRLRSDHLLRARARLNRWRSVVSPADVLTLLNGACGFLAIAVLAGTDACTNPGNPTCTPFDSPFFPGLQNAFPGLPSDRFLIAGALIVLGLVFDATDGMVARRFGGSRLGADLDTLSDTITFVVTPALMILKFYSNPAYIADPEPYAAALAASLVLVMGMLRLARFNANPTETDTKTFQGLPTPWCALTVVLTILIAMPTRFALPIFAILALLMMSNVAYPKSKGVVKHIAVALVLSAFGLATLLFFFPAGSGPVVRAAFILAAITIALAPFFLKRTKVAPEAAPAPALPGTPKP